MKWWQFNSIILILMFLLALWQGGHFNKELFYIIKEFMQK